MANESAQQHRAPMVAPKDPLCALALTAQESAGVMFTFGEKIGCIFEHLRYLITGGLVVALDEMQSIEVVANQPPIVGAHPRPFEMEAGTDPSKRR